MKTYTEFLTEKVSFKSFHLNETTQTSLRHEMENHPFLKSRGLKFHGLDHDSLDAAHIYTHPQDKDKTHIYHFMHGSEHHVHVYPGRFQNTEATHAGVGKTASEALNHLRPFKEYSKKYLGEETASGKEVPGAISDAGALKYVKQVNGKWALVSRHTGRPLKYFESKPSKETADSALRAVEFYKHS